MPIRIVLADDHPIVLRGLQDLLRAEPNFEVVAACITGEEAWKAIQDLKPDVAVIDVRMPGLDGLQLTEQVHKAKLATKVVLHTVSIEPDQIARAVQYNTRGIVLKEEAPERLVDCIRAVERGERAIPQSWMDRALDRLLRREAELRVGAAELTERELETVRLVAAGLSNKRIATRFGISEGTVKVHLHNVYRKLNVSNRVELTLYAQATGLAPHTITST
jgi:DNA-binding NarL/FixJ family response regulator